MTSKDLASTDHKKRALTNFKKAQGLLAKLIKMTEQEEYCVDIMQQNLAAIGLLRSAHQLLMEGHLKTCFTTAMSSKNEQRKQDMISEILNVTKLYNK